MENTVDFYTTGSACEGKYQYTEIAHSICNNDEFVFLLYEQPELVDVLLPKIENSFQIRQDLRPLWESKDAGLRYNAIVVNILHRFGLALSNPLTGTFAQVQDSFTLLDFDIDMLRGRAEDDPIEQKCKAARGIFMRIMESIAAGGLLHYVKHLYNTMTSIVLQGKVRREPIKQWCKQIIRVTMHVLKCAGEEPPLARFLDIPPPEKPVELITGVVPIRKSVAIRTCKHGVILKHCTNSAGVTMLACILHGHPGDCGETQPI